MKKAWFTTFQLILLALFSALIVVAKIWLRFPIRLSGHSGVFWMALVIVAAKVVPKRGAASIVGLISGLMAAFLGLGDFGALNTFFSYFLLGIGTDLSLMLLGDPENLFVASIAGALGHTCKFLFKWVFGIFSGVPIGFVAFGIVIPLVSYIFFGALGGLLGGLTIKALKKAGYFKYLAEKK